MARKIAELLESLPSDIMPVASLIIDGIADGLLDNCEALVDSLFNAGSREAYDEMVQTLSTDSLIRMLENVNTEMVKISDKYTTSKSRQEFLIKQVIVMGLTLLRKEVLEEIEG